MKECTICKKELSKELFHKTSSCCIPCKKDYNKLQYAKQKKLNKYKFKW